MLSQSWAVYFLSLALCLGSTTANPIKTYQIEVSDINLSNPLLTRAVCTPCTAGQAEYIYPTKMTGDDWTWKRKCINLCKAGTTLELDPKTKKYDCKPAGANCKRDGAVCTLPICDPKTQDMFKGTCVPKCKPGMVRSPATGKCGAGTGTTGAAQCTVTQESLNGKCVTKCTPPMVRNAVGKCAKAATTTNCPAAQELLNGKCVTKCTPPMVRNAAGKCATGKTTVKTPKCTVVQELVSGRCVPKCKAPKRRTASGACK